MITSILTNLGLSKEEAAIYQSLLDNGSQSATQLGKTTQVKRTYVYHICESLIKKNLIASQTKGRATVFVPQSPDLLLTHAEEQKLRATQAQQGLEGILPSLKGKYNLVENKPVVTFYEGIAGIKKVYIDTINNNDNKEILALVETSKVDGDIYKWVTTTFVAQRIKKGVFVKAIVATGNKTQTYTSLDQKELRKTKLINSTNFPFEHEINIYGDKIAIINSHKNSKLFAIIIDNPLIANTFRSWFHLAWQNIG
jgi:HTH-type transcriptional regulator, sugar sensing transcriptional regulator